MAKAELIIAEVNVQLTLTGVEAELLADILSHISGSQNSRRVLADDIYDALIELGFEWDPDATDIEGNIDFADIEEMEGLE